MKNVIKLRILCRAKILNKFNNQIGTRPMISVLCPLCILEHRTMILKFITLILIIIKSTRCSIVHDESNQETTYVSKYCPKQKYCKEGSHVVCMYYDHNHVFGPRCGNPVSVQLTPTMVQTILANVNDIRGKVATGTEKGKNDELLPRAYGLMKLEWDKELAFLAQVLANQCLGGREDVCRATEKFPNPSQTIAIVRYKYPNWEYLKPNNTDEGLNEEKLIFSIDRFLKSTHALKKSVTKSIITSCPRFHELPDVNLKYYLNLIRGGATHIGCGVSAYSKYRMSEDNDSMQNCVQIVCNISDAPKARQPVYKIIPPIPGHGYSKRCGCPKGYRESRSCLCEKDTKFTWKARDDAPTYNSIQATKNIKQKKGPQLKNQLKTGLKRDSKKGINNRPHNDAKNDEVRLASQNKPKPSIIRGIPKKRDKQTNGLKSPRIPSKSHHIIESKGNNSNHAKAKKVEDIESSDEFSRITNAIAPNNNYVIQKITDESNDIVIKFSLSSEAQDKKPVLKHENPENVFEDLIFKVRSLNSHGKKESTTVRPLHIVKENLAAKYRKPSEHHVVNNKKVVRLRAENKRTDFKHKRLLSILNSLEQEVNNIKFDDELKHLFDIKMRKIYKTGVNKSQETPSLIKLVTQHDEKDLKDLRHYLENENNASVENEIATLRRMIHRLSKGTQNDHELTYVENEINPNQNYNYVDQHFDEYHETQYDDDIGNLYEDIPSITAHSEHQDYDDKFNDISKSKHNAARQYDYSIDLRDNSKTRNQETFVNNDARQEILSTAIDHQFDNYDEKKVELEQRAMSKIINARQRVGRINKYLDRIEREENSGRRTSTFPDRRLQISHPFNRRHQNGDMRRKRMRRPNLLGTLRQSRNEPRQSLFSNERNMIMY